MTAPLEGLLVLDFTRAVAGPFCTLMLAELGARVIKIEEPDAGDETRQWGPPFVTSPAGGSMSTYFFSMNRLKESAAVDLKSARGRELVHAIAARADVVIENFRPGVAGRLGIGYADLARIQPRLVYCSVSGFGQSGPEKLRSGYDLIVQAISGSMHSSASPEQEAVKVSYPVSDLMAAMYSTQAILAALYARDAQGGTGMGRFIEISLIEGLLYAMSALAAGVLATGREPERLGTAQHNIVPYQLFHCRDVPIITGAPNDRLWARFCEALGRKHWLDDPRFQGNAARVANRLELVPLIEEALGTAPAAHWIDTFERLEIPCGPVLTLSEALASPQAQARGVVAETADPQFGPMRYVRSPIRLSGEEPPTGPAPLLGSATGALEREFLGESR